MQRWLAIAWLLGITNVVLNADDWTPNPLTDIKVPRIFRQGRTRSFLPQDLSTNRPSSTFDLKVSIPPNGNLVDFNGPMTDEIPFTAELESDQDNGQTSGIIGAQHTDPFPNEQMESTFPRQPLVSPPISSEAVPLDGAPRIDAGTIQEDDADKLSGNYASFDWIAGTGNRLGMLELDFKPSSRVWFDPIPPADGPNCNTLVDVEWGAKWLTGPDITDLPPYLFNILINVGQRLQVDDRLAIDAMISPGWWTDFSNKGVQAFRLPWHLVTFYRLDEDWHWVMGVTDLARDDIKYLPVVGTVYAPAGGDVRLDLVFPKPRIAWRIGKGAGSERSPEITGNGWTISRDKMATHWLTLGGELGGGSWAISRADRAYDVVTYRDYRLVAGLETKSIDGRTSRLEAGWIFDRTVQYRSNIGNYSPSDSLMIRISSDY